MQRGALFLGNTTINFDFPAPECEVVPGVFWGSLDAFPSPAYWAFQVLARRLENTRINYKLGTTLKEEVSACLLGGHGIPASVGVAAYEHLKERGAFRNEPPSEETILTWLSEPLNVNGRIIRYRFARQKSRYLSAALQKLSDEQAPCSSGRELRDWLCTIPGIGYKTSSWIARNWLDADDVAILDIHVFRAGVLGGFFKPEFTIEQHYLALEKQFIRLSHGLAVRTSELDAVIWHEMMSSPSTVFRAIEHTDIFPERSKKPHLRARPKQRQPHPDQTALLI